MGNQHLTPPKNNIEFRISCHGEKKNYIEVG